ncbi:hypothetical protein TNCV_4827061 [Trichonephila clavipes]|nr:hypothetical protein TNCV_4827061 [Trichonephila clavipes]
MDEQLKALLEGINALKSGQEDMQKSQEETKERMENMQRSQEETKNELKRRKVEQVEERIREQVDERIEEVAGNFSQRVEDLEKKLLACEKMNENKFVPTSAVPVPLCLTSISETVHL